MKPAALMLCLVGSASVVAAAQEPLSLATVLQRAGAYLADYERQISMVVSEEHYTQHTRDSRKVELRSLKSDILMADLGAEGWFGVRDVFEVNGQAVRDHQNRLLELVTSPAPETLTKARQIGQESARFNIGGVERNVNMPTFALMFLREPQQPRFAWTLGGRKSINGHDVVELRFVEKGLPRMIQTRDNAAARGWFSIDPAVGRIVRSELQVDSAGLTATVTVTFGPAPSITPWVPIAMDDDYRSNGRAGRPAVVGDPLSAANPATTQSVGVITGHATYRNFRTFGVQSNAVIKRE